MAEEKYKLILGDAFQIMSPDKMEAIKQTNKQTNKQTIIVTDPPFNIGYHYRSYKDNLEEAKYIELISGIIKNTPAVIVHYPETLYKIAAKINKTPEKVVAWTYNSNTAKQHRDIAFFDIKPDFKKVKQPYKNLNDKRIKERIARGLEGGRLYDWWNINQVKNVSKEKTEHPCQMPQKVMENIVGILPEKCLIIDPFAGSGTTGVAVKSMNKKQKADREFLGIEIDEVYYNIAKERINQEEEEKWTTQKQ